MTWADFYLLCFAVGFLFSFFSFLLGGTHWHLHLPHGGVHLHGAAHAARGSHAASPINPLTLAAFLAWFGGTGYLLTRFSTVWFVFGLTIAIGSGLIASAAIYLFLSKVLASEHENLDSEDFGMVGALGKLSMPIREGGTGELIYSQAGTRRTCGARADDPQAVFPKGSEVVVTRYEKGLAYVRLWSEIAGEEPEKQDEQRANLSG
jgi:membrane protein implicated in regulation of membrane protease activity